MARKQKRRLAGAALLLLCGSSLLTACGPESPSVAPIAAEERLALAPAPAPLSLDPAWWRLYGDPTLDRVIDLSLRQAPSLDLARARYQESLAALRLVRSGEWPNLSLDGSLDRQRETQTGVFPPPLAGKIIDDTEASVGLGYELDLWGKRASSIREARSQAAAAEADSAAARLFLTGAVAQAYFALQTDLNRLALARQVTKLRAEQTELSQARLQAGREAVSPTLEARGNQAAARLSVEQAMALVAVDRDQLAALAGIAEARLPEIAIRPLPAPPAPPAGLSIDLLAQRPEIESNRQAVEAARNQTEAARAEFYPDITFSALLGQSTINSNFLFQLRSQSWGYGPALHLPLFDGGRLSANLGIAKAQLDEAVARYNQSVIDAVQQAADAYSQLHGTEAQIGAAENTLEQLRRLLAVQDGRLQSGLSDRSAILQAQSAVLAQESLLIDLRGRRLAFSVSLFKALGGGYRAPAATAQLQPTASPP